MEKGYRVRLQYPFEVPWAKPVKKDWDDAEVLCRDYNLVVEKELICQVSTIRGIGEEGGVRPNRLLIKGVSRREPRKGCELPADIHGYQKTTQANSYSFSISMVPCR